MPEDQPLPPIFKLSPDLRVVAMSTDPQGRIYIRLRGPRRSGQAHEVIVTAVVISTRTPVDLVYAYSLSRGDTRTEEWHVGTYGDPDKDPVDEMYGH